MKKIILSLFLFLGIFLHRPISPLAQTCGGSYQFCCTSPGSTACDNSNGGNLSCIGGRCVPGSACGNAGQACCTGNICNSGISCINGSCGASGVPGSSTDTSDPMAGCGANSINTAIGCIPVGDTNAFMGWILGWAVGVGGGIAFLLIVYASFMIMTSQGVPDRLKAGQELLTSAISGLIMLIFAVFILKFIGIDILKLDQL